MTPPRLLAALASLRLTVTLLALAMVLIFAGTLAQTTQGVWQVVDSYFRSWLAWIDLGLFLPRAPERPLPVPFPGGLTIAGAMLINLIAAHSLRFKATRKRAGIILLHAGLIVLLAGEFVTAFTAREGVMHIDEGAASSYTEDIRRVELAVIDPSAPDFDRVTVVPQPLLERHAASGQPLTSPDLPFQVRVLSWLPNSVLERAGDANHRGVAQRLRPLERPRARGVDGADADVPSAYLHLTTPDADLGTWLVSANLINPQPIEVAGRTYQLALRFAREYRPYTIALLDFRHDKFTGTEVARNFSSHVRLSDPSRAVEREAVISMNQPLRYQGETFYQASFKPDDSGTVLQVVRNPGWLLPYASCIMVGVGLLWHFTARLLAFVRRRTTRDAQAQRPRAGGVLFAGACLVGIALSLQAAFRPQPSATFDTSGLAAMPVSAGGRIKPFDTVARSALLAAGGRQSVRDEHGPRTAVSYTLDLIAHPERIKDVPVAKVDHPDLLTLLGKDSARPARLSLAELEPHWREVTAQAGAALELPPKQRDPFQRAVLKLHAGVGGLLNIAQMGAPYWVPPRQPGDPWRPFHDVFQEARQGLPDAEGATTIARVMTAYHDGDQAAFDAAIAEHAELVARSEPAAHSRAALEVWFNRAQPFLGAGVVYVLAFLVLAAALLLRARGGGERLRRAGVGLIAGAFIIHTAALLLRMYLQGRPPVTNLYSSAVFVGWAAAGLGLLLERWYPVALGVLASAAIGFSTLVIAHNLGDDGDTMQVMQAVLDTNFWLATHVVTITLGYSTSLLAGLLGAAYLLARALRRGFSEDRSAPLGSMIYGVVCAAMLLSFVGTVLGGIWADQSWGRFWGWDPKENGAALVVLMNAIILHARWGGLVRPPGVAALAVLGNAVVAWSWFGTNMLGVGLHSYGFMDSAALWLVAFVCANMAMAGLAALPARAARVNAPS